MAGVIPNELVLLARREARRGEGQSRAPMQAWQDAQCRRQTDRQDARRICKYSAIQRYKDNTVQSNNTRQSSTGCRAGKAADAKSRSRTHGTVGSSRLPGTRMLVAQGGPMTYQVDQEHCSHAILHDECTVVWI